MNHTFDGAVLIVPLSDFVVRWELASENAKTELGVWLKGAGFTFAESLFHRPDAAT